MNDYYALLAGLLLRIGLPILVTFGLVNLLSRMDARWQEEARQQERPVLATDQMPCWEQRGCSPEQIKACPAVNSGEPCWQAFRQSNGYLAPKCLECQVFSGAAAPAKS